MLKSINHRGPDNSRKFVDQNLYLGSTRVKILDLDNRSNMPMEIDDFVIVYNGEIYNHKILKKKLEDLGEKFLTTSDTKVILRLFKKYEYDSFKLLEGMFSVCIYNKKNKKLILARDIFGIKPLYYTFYNNNFIFSSEVNSIKKNLDYNLKKNQLAIYSFLHKGSIIESQTQYKSLYSLKPGIYL